MGRKYNKSKSNHIRGKKGSQFRSELRGVDLERVLIVAIDAAKFFQKVLVCNYFGDVLLEPTSRIILFHRIVSRVFGQSSKWRALIKETIKKVPKQ